MPRTTNKRKEAPVEEEADKTLEAKRTKDDDSEDNVVVPPALAAAAAAAAVAAGDNTAVPPIMDDAVKAAAKKRNPTTVDPSKNPTDPTNFNDYIFHLLAFKAQNNNFSVTKDDDPFLHAFLQHVKREYKTFQRDRTTSVMSEQQMKVLEFLHVPLTSRGDDHWNRFFELLLQYKNTHDHVLVPRLCEIPGLGDWCTDQRRQHKSWKQGSPTNLTTARREKLESVGFVWTVRNRPEWDSRFAELLDYKTKNKDCKVPQHYKENRALGKWVAKQREQYKLLKKGQHSFLTPLRLERLNEIGFVWSVRTALDGGGGGEPQASVKLSVV